MDERHTAEGSCPGTDGDITQLAREILRRHRMSFDFGTSIAVNCYPAPYGAVTFPQPSVSRVRLQDTPSE